MSLHCERQYTVNVVQKSATLKRQKGHKQKTTLTKKGKVKHCEILVHRRPFNLSICDEVYFQNKKEIQHQNTQHKKYINKK